MRILFTICGRAGSKGLKNKNLKEMNGVPLVYYTLAAIWMFLETHSTDYVNIALNTDSRELEQLICKQTLISDIYLIKRKESLAGDLVPKIAVIKDTYEECKQFGKYDLVIDLDITSPVRKVSHIEEIIRTLSLDKKCDLAFSVVESRRSPYFNMVKKNGTYYQKVCASDFTARQQVPDVYELNASIYGYKPDFLDSKIEKTILEYNCQIVQMPDYLVLDIDSEADFKQMSFLMPLFAEEDSEIQRLVETAKLLQLSV